MPPTRPVIEPLRDALVERSAVQSIRRIADAAGVDYKRLLAFSQGGPPAFDAMDVDRLATVLGLRLTFDVPAEPDKRAKQKP
jgi:hypothetical protein